jgi:hypothetical protein
VPWAGQPALSFLIAPQDLRELLERSGFRVLTWRDSTEAARQWCQALLQQRRQSNVPALGIHLLLGDTAAAKFQNLGRNLSEGRIAVSQGVLERP